MTTWEDESWSSYLDAPFITQMIDHSTELAENFDAHHSSRIGADGGEMQRSVALSLAHSVDLKECKDPTSWRR